MTVVALVPAAGRGERLGMELPKALVPVRGVPLLTHAVRRLLASGCVDSVVVATPQDRVDAFAAAVGEFGRRCRLVPGGADRSSSVRLALESVDVGTCEVVLVHDAARAFTPPAVVRTVVDAVSSGSSAVVPVLPIANTVKVVDVDGVITATPDRAALRSVQTPQGFAEAVLRAAHAAGFDGATDDAGLVEQLGGKVHTVPGHAHAMKITTPFDLVVAEAILARQEGSA
ncbi:MAG: 2-C-methyl-D-erythritol 4-phosphate cytidylyltransferase, partial [Haloechinothrix sp.]